MGTRSVVAIQNGDGFKGRYIHWDGYPSGVGESLLAIVQRDGVEKARQVLTVDHYGWSGLDSSTTADSQLGLGMDDGRFTIVPGYGTAYTTHAGQSDPDDWIESDGADSGTEWAYVLRDNELTVLERVYKDSADDTNAQHATGWFGVSHKNDEVAWVVRGVVPYSYTAGSVADVVGDEVG